MSKEALLDYNSALERLLGLLDTERAPAPASGRERKRRYDLRRMEALLHRLGDPQVGTNTVHIAGTKGKGSTAAMCASVLSRQGYPTGLYTSPHMHTFRERIQLDGAPVTGEEFAGLVEEIWTDLEWVSGNGEYGEVTMFEALTAMAFTHFRRRAGFQVLEVGLGGRLDTTNVVRPPDLKVCAITSLSLDHTGILGDTLEKIAGEKAGIIKPRVKVVSAPQKPEAMAVLESVCHERGADLIKVGQDLTWRKGPAGLEGQGLEVHGRLGSYNLWTPLLGEYQLENVTVAVGVLEVLQEQGSDLSGQALYDGISQVRWPCRMEVLKTSPLVVCDGAHNPYSAARLRESVPGYFKYNRIILIAGVNRDHSLEGIVHELIPLSARVIATRSRHPKAARTDTVAEAFRSQGSASLVIDEVENVGDAVSKALEEAGEGDLVLATGSLFVAAEVREAIMGIEPELYPDLNRRT